MIGINQFASLTLVSELSPLTDQTFSLGSEAGLTLMNKYLKHDYDLSKLAPDVDLEERGFRVGEAEPF